MPEFLWVETPPYGVCFGCGTSANDRGFVRTFADVDVKRDGEIVGIADVHFCGNCLASMARLVGCAQPDEVEAFAHREYELETELEKARDEAAAWAQRFDTLMSDSFAENVRKVIEDEKPEKVK